VKHQDAPETPVIDAFCNVDALDDVVALPIDDLPRVAHEVVVRVDAARADDRPCAAERTLATLFLPKGLLPQAAHGSHFRA
jgi:hypothetical protein